MSGTDDPALISKASQGDPDSLEFLLHRHLPGLRTFVRLRTGRCLRAKESVSDLVQSVCREILDHQDRFQYPGDEQFRKWLYTTAVRKIAHRHEYYLAAKRDTRLEWEPGSQGDVQSLLEAARPGETPSQHAMAREQSSLIEKAFSRLNEEQRAVITWSRMGGLSHAEIAQEMGKTPGAVRTLLSRSLARLAEVVDELRGS